MTNMETALYALGDIIKATMPFELTDRQLCAALIFSVLFAEQSGLSLLESALVLVKNLSAEGQDSEILASMDLDLPPEAVGLAFTMSMAKTLAGAE